MSRFLDARFLLAASLICTGAAHAGGTPDPSNSNVPQSINLGGRSGLGFIVDPLVGTAVIIYDASSVPVAGAVVAIRFGNCFDIDLCDPQPHHSMLDCGLDRVSEVTDMNGVAYFRIAGGAVAGPGNPPGAGMGCATVTVDGVPFGNMTVGAYDNNMSNGVDPADLANWLSDRVGTIQSPAGYRGRSDFNGTGTIDPADGALILRVRAAGGSTLSCSTICL